MKHYIRRTEAVTIVHATRPLELDSSEFESLSENPYTGSTEQEFAEYIASYAWEDAKGELSEETQEMLDELFYGDTKEIYNSSDKGGNTKIELGELSSNSRGGFTTKITV